MIIQIELDELKDRFIRTGLIPEGYDVVKIESGAYSRELRIELERRQTTIAKLDRPLYPPQPPCVVDGSKELSGFFVDEGKPGA